MSIEAGDRVTLEYVGRFPDGTVFDTSRESVAVDHGLIDTDRETSFEPLTFVVGAEQVVEGLDDGVRGLSAGETATVEIPPEKAYGPVEEDRIREYDAESFAGMVGQEPEVGLHVHAENGLHGDVIAVTEDTVEVDFNHELAGKTLVFEVEILRVESA
jgi:peptidyl-prolyl cis-trans isomerase B (cyclophilin B)